MRVIYIDLCRLDSQVAESMSTFHITFYELAAVALS